ncbi:unnamed protein product [Linum tenue]|uniref:Core Histone H2A/H2B/H3 domain-containing protein n=1 Tax=Linum tenue TaxID=586396 RepID=A0AAV0N2L1_9ROSI|nr:unnamed protein product [Linum tenue]
MAPKRSKRRVVGVVRSTRKVVKETVQVSFLSGDGDTQEDVDDATQDDINNLVDSQETIDVDLTPVDQPIVVERQEETTTVRTIPVEEVVTPDVAEVQRHNKPPSPKEPAAAASGLSEEATQTQQTEEAEKGTVEEGGGGEKKAKKRGGGVEGEGYGRYVYKVMKEVHPEMRISAMAMSIVNSLMKDMFERIADEAATLTSRVSRKQTMSFREVQDAVRLILPGDLGKHAVAEGSKAVAKYAAYQKKNETAATAAKGK